MSIARVRSFAFSGIDAVPVEVQVQIAGGLPAFLIVGLPDKTVGEARERVRATLSVPSIGWNEHQLAGTIFLDHCQGWSLGMLPC